MIIVICLERGKKERDMNGIISLSFLLILYFS